MTPRQRLLLALGIAAAMAACGCKGTGGPSAAAPRKDGPAGKAKDAPAKDERAAKVQQALEQKVILDFEDTPIQDVVAFISSEEGLAWNPVKAPSAEPTGKLKEALAKPVTLDFADTPMGDVATFVSDFAGVSIVADKSAEKALATVKVKDIPLKDALELTVIQARLKCQISGDKLLILR